MYFIICNTYIPIGIVNCIEILQFVMDVSWTKNTFDDGWCFSAEECIKSFITNQI